MFSGPRAPVATALVWCGWEVQAADKLFGPGHNLADPAAQHQWTQWLDNCHAQVWAPACDTLSRAREIPVKGHRGPPQPLRTEEAVRGVALLSEKLSLRVKEANSFIDFSFNSINRALGRGSAAVLESPERSWLWQFQQAIELDNDPSWQATEYCACAHLAARCKRQKLKSNVEELSAAAAECHHLHSAHDWDPVKCQDGSWHYPGSQEAEYSAHLAFTIAVALSWWVVRMGIFPLPIPPQLQPLEAGSRLQWADRRKSAIAMSLCRRWPKDSALDHHLSRCRNGFRPNGQHPMQPHVQQHSSANSSRRISSCTALSDGSLIPSLTGRRIWSVSREQLQRSSRSRRGGRPRR